jgi:hypothetical protein
METLPLSGGMSVRAPLVEIGVKVGTIRIERVEVLVVDDGFHGVLLGSELIKKAFAVGEHGEVDVSVSSSSKEDPTALSIELYPLQMPFDLRLFEKFLRYQRRLYNVLLIAEKGLTFSTHSLLEDAIENDYGIPDDFTLQLSAIDSGSIWTSLTSGAQSTLKRLASLFDTSASAKLAQHLAEARKAEIDVGISADARDATANRLIAEQEMLRAENIRKTYEIWRKEVKARVNFSNDLISQVQDESTRADLIKKRDDAIRELADQQLLPMVRNIPRPFEPPPGLFLLPGKPS